MASLASLACAAVVVFDRIYVAGVTCKLFVAIWSCLNMLSRAVLVLWGAYSRYCMGASSSRLYGDCSARHLRRHRITCPTAQGQQDEHEGEDQVAHWLMIVG